MKIEEDIMDFDYKTRNILNIDERVQVIKYYDRLLPRPSYQSLANKFQCSSKQIKNILSNRDSILDDFSNGRVYNVGNEVRDERLQKRKDKIEFLGKVMFEFVERCVYHNYELTDDKVIQKAASVKEAIAIANFQPSITWLTYFMANYDIPSFDFYALRNNILLTENKPRSVSTMDIIQFISRREQKKARKRSGAVQRHVNQDNYLLKADEFRNHYDEIKIVYQTDITDTKNSNIADSNVCHTYKQTNDAIKINVNDKSICKDSTNSCVTSNNNNCITSNNNNSTNIYSNTSSIKQESNIKRCLPSPYPDIESVDEALRHLRALEEYAMLQENYRAIGLLTQLEQIFVKQPKNELR